jgi:uncharacterized protein DUF6166
MKIEGYFRTREVFVDGRLLSPKKSQQVWNHSPDGFAWGYAGSGPAQLALALLLRAGIKAERAVRLHQQFKADVIQRLPQTDFVTTIDVLAWADTASRGSQSGPVGDVL